MTVWNLALVRVNPTTFEEVQHDTVMSLDDETSPHTLGGTLLALAFTTTVVTVPNGEAFDFVMHRDDPYTGDPIGDTVIIEGFTEVPDTQWPTAEDMRVALRNGIAYIPEAAETP
jgi:hypothetical protein